MTRWSQDALPLWPQPQPISEEYLPYPHGLPATRPAERVAGGHAALMASRGPCGLCGGAPLLPRGFDHTTDCPITLRARRRAGEVVPRRRRARPPTCAFCGTGRDVEGRIEHSPNCRVLLRRDTLERAS